MPPLRFSVAVSKLFEKGWIGLGEKGRTNSSKIIKLGSRSKCFHLKETHIFVT